MPAADSKAKTGPANAAEEVSAAEIAAKPAGVAADAAAKPAEADAAAKPADAGSPRISRSAADPFTTTVRPILSARCGTCHDPGGKMYARLPFDRPATIVKLGTKLFTRIKDEKEQRLIREFIAQP